MLKIFSCLFFAVSLAAAFPKVENERNVVVRPAEKPAAVFSDDSEFYSPELLKSDLEQVDVVAYVNIVSRELADKLTDGDCEKNEGPGYCLYLLKAEVKEVFKGKIEEKNFEFYTSIDADYKNKDSLLGEKVVFLNRSDNYPDKKISLGAMENSTRSIKHNVLEKLRKIAADSKEKATTD